MVLTIFVETYSPWFYYQNILCKLFVWMEFRFLLRSENYSFLIMYSTNTIGDTFARYFTNIYDVRFVDFDSK